MTSVLLAAPGPVADIRAGPAIRFWEFARALCAEHTVTLLCPNEDHPVHPGFHVCTCTEQELGQLAAGHQVVVVQGPALQQHPGLASMLVPRQHCLVVDLYDPVSLELLVAGSGEAERLWHAEYSHLLDEQLRLGDFFLCASERQRDYWLGALAALGRINADTYDGGDLRQLIDVVPFGLPASPPLPLPGGPVLKGAVPGIGSDDRVVVWGGGLWDWLDPLTPIQAMERVAARRDEVRLVFFESERYRSGMLGRAKDLAAQKGLLGSHVFFVPWLPPDEWAACLLEADAGLSYHPASIEAHFAYRTRLLDYIWAGLPIITAGGDVLSDVVAGQGLGYVVPPGDVEALARALGTMLDEPDPRRSRAHVFRHAAQGMAWERVTEPLQRYCRRPRPAGDAGSGIRSRPGEAGRRGEQRPQAEVDRARSDLARAERLRIEADTRAQRLEARLSELSGQLERSQDELHAAMGGRVMRLITSTQRACRRLAHRRQYSEGKKQP